MRRRKAPETAAGRLAQGIADKAAAMPETAARRFIREAEENLHKFPGSSADGLPSARGTAHVPGVMNATEAAFFADYVAPKMADGSLLWYKFEGIKLRIEDNCTFTADWALMRADGIFFIVDVKALRKDGTIQKEDDAVVKMRSVAALYPFPVLMAAGRLEAGGWIWRHEWIKAPVVV